MKSEVPSQMIAAILAACVSMLLVIGPILSSTLTVHSQLALSQIIILTHSGWIDSIGYYHVSGEVQNTGETAADYVKVTATFYDTNNGVVGTDFAYSTLHVLLPSRKSPFELILFDKNQSEKVDHYSLSSTYETTNPIPESLEILSYSSYRDTIGIVHVVGEVKNAGNISTTFVMIAVTFYDTEGTVVASDFTYSDPSDLEPDQTAPFDSILIYDERAPSVSKFILTAESEDYAIIHEQPRPDTTPPATSQNYDGTWHTTAFTISLTATDDISGVAQTSYRINGGPTLTVRTNGQPHITTENSNNTLEYWSVDKQGNEELPHNFLTEIKLDKTTPTGSININNTAYTTSTLVILILNATDTTSGISQARYSNNAVWNNEPWESFSGTKNWNLTNGDGTKTVHFQIKDNAGLISTTYTDTIILDTTPPTGSITINQGAHCTNSTQVTLQLSANDTGSGVNTMRFSNDNNTWSVWEEYHAFKNWTTQTDDGAKQVYTQFTDKVGSISETYSATIMLDTTAPTIENVTRQPNGPVNDNQLVGIAAEIADPDSGPSSVTIVYFTNRSAVRIELVMTLNETSGLYESTIRWQDADTLVKYQVTAFDNAGNSVTDDNHGQYYSFTVSRGHYFLGDLNLDGKVDQDDLNMITGLFGANHPNPRYNPVFDLNKDLRIDMRDIGTVARHFGEHYP